MLLLAWPGLSLGEESHRPLRVLFVGNSYLYTNNLPNAVQMLAASRGTSIETTMLAEPNYSLSEHLRDSRFDELLQAPWDWVVLQQGPSSLPASKRELVENVRLVSRRLQGRPTRIALMSAWPARGNAATSSQGEANYREAAMAIDACLLPVAGAWRVALAQSKPSSLYQRDRLHPTPLGTLLAAMTVTRGLIAMDPAQSFDAPRDADPAELARFRLLDDAARVAQSQEAARCTEAVVATDT